MHFIESYFTFIIYIFFRHMFVKNYCIVQQTRLQIEGFSNAQNFFQVKFLGTTARLVINCKQPRSGEGFANFMSIVSAAAWNIASLLANWLHFDCAVLGWRIEKKKSIRRFCRWLMLVMTRFQSLFLTWKITSCTLLPGVSKVLEHDDDDIACWSISICSRRCYAECDII